MGANATRPRRVGDAAAHYDLLDERCVEIVATVIKELETRKIEYVLGGGWAVYAYESHVPSVDTDVFLHAKDEHIVAELMRSRGIGVGPGRQFEPLSLDEPNNLLGPDIDMQEPERGYVPAKILAGRTERRTLELGAKGQVDAAVPSAPALLFMKLKAYHDRELSWSALRDDAVMATRIPTADRPQVRQMTVSHYYRKAGKDLYDAAFLATRHAALDEALAIARGTGLHDDIKPLVESVHEPLRQFALDMTRAEADDATAAWISKLARR